MDVIGISPMTSDRSFQMGLKLLKSCSFLSLWYFLSCFSLWMACVCQYVYYTLWSHGSFGDRGSKPAMRGQQQSRFLPAMRNTDTWNGFVFETEALIGHLKLNLRNYPFHKAYNSLCFNALKLKRVFIRYTDKISYLAGQNALWHAATGFMILIGNSLFFQKHCIPLQQ